MSKPETIPDIIAEMRRGTKLPGYWLSSDLNKILAYHADRPEAAVKRELGNAAKLREIVELLARVILPPQEEHPAEYGGGKVPDKDGWLAWIRQMQVRACDALASPPRNCDTMNWREAWDAWRAKRQIGKPQSAKEAYDLTVQFLDWFTSASEKNKETEE